jgi:hypothetical protein
MSPKIPNIIDTIPRNSEVPLSGVGDNLNGTAASGFRGSPATREGNAAVIFEKCRVNTFSKETCNKGGLIFYFAKQIFFYRNY